MRARIVVAVLGVVVLIAGALAASQRFSGDATAREVPQLPILVNEVSDWCVEATGDSCNDIAYQWLPDGTLHAVLDVDENDGVNGICARMVIPPDVTGWAHLAVLDSKQGRVVATDEVRSTDYVCELVIRRR
jgi:hypothetical protein